VTQTKKNIHHTNEKGEMESVDEEENVPLEEIKEDDKEEEEVLEEESDVVMELLSRHAEWLGM
jgi:hypothetical protein